MDNNGWSKDPRSSNRRTGTGAAFATQPHKNAGSSLTSQDDDTTCGAESSNCPFAKIAGSKAYASVESFIKDYIERHSHPVNASLHVLGVPAAFLGFFYCLSGRDVPKGMVLIFVGYLLQYLGHRAQGNEVGEVTLIKHLYRKVKSRIST